MQTKFNDILLQYSKEVDIIDEMFRSNRYGIMAPRVIEIFYFMTQITYFSANPPVAKNQPKVAGAINWCRSLFTRIKKSIVRFQVVPEMLTSELGKSVTKKYITVAKSMREYEELVWFASEL
jgi:dynein heavy chain